jgi:hypothetical protein
MCVGLLAISVKVKAYQYQIESIELEETLLLPSEPDPLEKKNRELTTELLRYKSRRASAGSFI